MIYVIASCDLRQSHMCVNLLVYFSIFHHKNVHFFGGENLSVLLTTLVLGTLAALQTYLGSAWLNEGMSWAFLGLTSGSTTHKLEKLKKVHKLDLCVQSWDWDIHPREALVPWLNEIPAQCLISSRCSMTARSCLLPDLQSWVHRRQEVHDGPTSVGRAAPGRTSMGWTQEPLPCLTP